MEGMSMFKTIDTLEDINGKRVLVRVDLNVPTQGGKISDDTRLRATKATILDLVEKGAIVLLCAHFGRPKGQIVPDMSLSPITGPLSTILGQDVHFIPNCMGEDAKTAVGQLQPGSVAVWKIHASIRARRQILRNSHGHWQILLIFISMMHFLQHIAPMHQRKVSLTFFQLMQAARWRRN